MFSIPTPFDIDRVSALSLEDKAKYLDLLLEVSEGRKIPKAEFSTNIDLSAFIEVGLVKLEVKKEKYWEDGKFFLNKSDFDKLNELWSKEEIDKQIKAFKSWKSPKKNTRTNIYLTIRKWISDSNKFKLTQEQQTFIEKSYYAYEESTKTTGNSKSKYANCIIKLLEKKYNLDDIRDFLKKSILKEIDSSSDPQFRRRIHNVISDFENWKDVVTFE